MDISSGPGDARPKILLLSGTSEGPRLARALLAADFDVHATVTRTEAIATLFGPASAYASDSASGALTVEARGFTDDSLTEFLAAGLADLVVDATHPFAVRITEIARRVCTARDVPLVRFLRPDWEPPAGTRLADSFAEAADLLPALGRRILLTIGAKKLKHFAGLHERVTLFARVLPGEVSFQQAQRAGFALERIVAARPPFTQADNRALFEKLGIDVLLTKASGREGGVAEKVLAAAELGIQVVMIRRPAEFSTDLVETIEAAVGRVQQLTRR
ncbi:MAG: precorrin-6A reductase [Gemmataceae bacterium]